MGESGRSGWRSGWKDQKHHRGSHWETSARKQTPALERSLRALLGSHGFIREAGFGGEQNHFDSSDENRSALARVQRVFRNAGTAALLSRLREGYPESALGYYACGLVHEVWFSGRAHSRKGQRRC